MMADEQKPTSRDDLLKAALAKASIPAEPAGGIPLDFSTSKPQEPASAPAPAPAPAPKKRGRIPFSNPQATLNMLDKNQYGKPRSCLRNAILLLRFHPAWNVPPVLFFDEFGLQICTRNSPPWGAQPGRWSDTDDVRTAEWMQSLGVFVTPATVRDAVESIAKETPVHPVRDYLNSLRWDKKPRVGSWLLNYLGCENTVLNREIGKCWMIGACSRVMRPSSKMDYVLSLEGRQGVGKSTALRALAGDEWFSDHISDLSNKDSRIELLSKWVIELSELAAVRRSDNERVKAFLTAQYDYYRPPYGRRPCQIPRQCVFAATFNDQTPFTDDENRRYWPVACGGHIKVRQLEQDRDQLWAEAYRLFQAGAIWWFDSAELNEAVTEQQRDRVAGDAWDEAILIWALDPQPRTVSDAPLLSRPEQVTTAEVLMHAIGKTVEHWDRNDEMRVARCFKRAGWTRKRIPPKYECHFYLSERRRKEIFGK